jgi:hypothetical protein
VDPVAGHTAVVVDLAGRGWEGLADGALGVFEEAAGSVEVVEDLAVGVAENVGVRMVDAHGDDDADRVTLAVLAGTGPRLSGVAVEGGVLGPVPQVRLEGADAGDELGDLVEGVGGLAGGGFHGASCRISEGVVSAGAMDPTGPPR